MLQAASNTVALREPVYEELCIEARSWSSTTKTLILKVFSGMLWTEHDAEKCVQIAIR